MVDPSVLRVVFRVVFILVLHDTDVRVRVYG